MSHCPTWANLKHVATIYFVPSTCFRIRSFNVSNSKLERAPSKFNNFPVHGHHLSPLLFIAAPAPQKFANGHKTVSKKKNFNEIKDEIIRILSLLVKKPRQFPQTELH